MTTTLAPSSSDLLDPVSRPRRLGPDRAADHDHDPGHDHEPGQDHRHGPGHDHGHASGGDDEHGHGGASTQGGPHRHAPARPPLGMSLVRASLVSRFAVAGGLSVLIWLAVAWARLPIAS